MLDEIRVCVKKQGWEDTKKKYSIHPLIAKLNEKEGKITGYAELQQLTFSPNWRQDYAKLNKFRWCIYAQYILLKAVYHPIKLLQQPFRIITKRFKTKMEMTVYRAAKLAYLTREN